MKIVALSDLHGHLPDRIPACDLLVIAGDICPDYVVQREWLDTAFRSWLSRRRARHVVATWGNHDFAGEAGDVPPLPCTFLVDETIEIDGLRIHGTPWTPVCSRFAFTEDEDVLEGCFSRIPSNLDLLISHGPPHEWADLSRHGTHDGSIVLRQAVERARPRVTICGHVHRARGSVTVPWGRVENVASLDEARVPRAMPYVTLTHRRR